ncbi:MAG: hypothetical protein ABI361_01870 [Nitrososphaera sp.]
MSDKEEIIAAMEQLEAVQQKYLPKVDRKLFVDLFMRLRDNPEEKPMYTIEAFLKRSEGQEEVRAEAIRQQIMDLTGMAPEIFDNATHVVVNYKLDYELLKEIQNRPEVEEVTGSYMGSMASIGAAHERSTQAGRRDSEYRYY